MNPTENLIEVLDKTCYSSQGQDIFISLDKSHPIINTRSWQYIYVNMDAKHVVMLTVVLHKQCVA